jgi:hypothetical protein
MSRPCAVRISNPTVTRWNNRAGTPPGSTTRSPVQAQADRLRGERGDPSPWTQVERPGPQLDLVVLEREEGEPPASPARQAAILTATASPGPG